MADDTLDAFTRAVFANPDDPAPRLVLADWMDERGDPRAEALRRDGQWTMFHEDGRLVWLVDNPAWGFKVATLGAVGPVRCAICERMPGLEDCCYVWRNSERGEWRCDRH